MIGDREGVLEVEKELFNGTHFSQKVRETWESCINM